MNAPEMKVRCSVENCHFNKGRMCHADSLDVDTSGSDSPDTSEGTCCRTFKDGK